MSGEPQFPNSAFVRAPERLVLRGGRWAQLDLAVRYGLFDHPSAGNCLIDTGYSRRVTSGLRSFPLSVYNLLLRPKLTSQALPEACPQVGAILLSHLHADHVSALRDYPDATIFAHGESIDHFLGSGWFHRAHHGVFKELLPEDLLDRIVRFEDQPAVQAPHGLGPGHDVFGDGSVLAVPLPGHMRGHMGFCWPKLDRALLYAADAQWLHRAVMNQTLPPPPARWILDDPEAALNTSARIAAFAEQGGRVVYCHDPDLDP
jgi:glyoxylase-like metal-dependent hydrolase (beta-lactamase superfamily II)